MNNLLIFAGTTEGRLLTEAISKNPKKGCKYFVCVATEHGKHLLPKENSQVHVIARRMEPEQMQQLMQKEKITKVIDATHPYAQQASFNIQKAAGDAGVSYVRLLRESVSVSGHIIVPDVKAAVEYLKEHSGKVLLTTGSRDLALFTEIKDYQTRLYPRILPAPEMVKKAFDLGFDTGHLICMQGPFSHEMNTAMLRQTGAKYLVTKESGKAGGFKEKITAAEEACARVIIIGRPQKEEGISLQEAIKLCGAAEEPKEEVQQENRAWFPLFINIKGKKVLVAGAGKIASRRIKTLSLFHADITVVAPQKTESAEKLTEKGVRFVERAFEEADLNGMDLVVAATDDRDMNQRIGRLCKKRGIPVNVADKKEECDFYFPGIVQKGSLTIGITAGGENHSLTVKCRELIEDVLEKELDK